MPKSAIPVQRGGSGANVDTFKLPADPSVQFTPTLNTHREVLIDEPHEARFTNTSYRMIGRNGTVAAPIATPTVRTLGVLDMVDASNTYSAHIISITVDWMSAAQAGASLAAPFPIRVVRGTSANRTGGNTLTRVVENNSGGAGFALGQFYCDASADGTNSASALVFAQTVTSGLAAQYSPRYAATSASGYESADRIEFEFNYDALRLVNGEAVGVIVDNVASRDYNHHHWIVTFRWGVRTL